MQPGGTGTPELRTAHAQGLLSAAGGACAPQSRGRLGRGAGSTAVAGFCFPRPFVCLVEGRCRGWWVVGRGASPLLRSVSLTPHPTPVPVIAWPSTFQLQLILEVVKSAAFPGVRALRGRVWQADRERQALEWSVCVE